MDPGSLISLVIAIALVGLVVWAIVHLIPMPPPFKTVIYVVAGVALLFYLLNFFGLWHGFPTSYRPLRRG